MRPSGTPRPVTVDFETYKVEPRPHYPPKPVGVSIKYPDQPPYYYAWGHHTGNNCTQEEATLALAKAYTHPDGLLFQNAKFDLDVAEVYMGIKPPSWDRIHDTMFLLFLDDPHQKELGLKPSAKRLLGIPPEEQDAVKDWLIDNQPIEGVRLSTSKQSDNYFGKYIAYAPGALVGAYANGDVIRTERIFELLYPKTISRGMSLAYDRERKLLLILLEMERQGLPVDLIRLEEDVTLYEEWCTKLDQWIKQTLNAGEDINLDSSAELLKAMVAANKVNISALPLTQTGRHQTTKEALLLGVTDKQLLGVLIYRTQLLTCLTTFMKPWLVSAKASSGYIFTSWNQIKAPSGDSSIGTRTGRLSSTPNLMNIPKRFAPIFHHEDLKESLPTSPFDNLPPLPKVRSYIIPFKGDVFIDRDFSQQELRILAHFDGCELQTVYNNDPWVDFHDYAKTELEKVGKFYDRKKVKNTNLGIIYGMGVAKLADKNGTTLKDASDLKKSILTLYPGLKEMYDEMRVRSSTNRPIKTFGGREYYCEPPKYKDGKVVTYDYKMVNLLIQGSAADCTKEALIRYFEIKHKDAKIVLNVHDQITVSVPTRLLHREMENLRYAMESIEFDVKMLSEGSLSLTTWEELKDYDKKGAIV